MSVLSIWTMPLLTKCGKQNNGSQTCPHPNRWNQWICYLIWPRGFTVVIKLRRWRDYPGATNVIIKVLISRGRRVGVREEIWKCYAAGFIFFFFLNYYLFIYFWLCWVFVSARGLPPAAASGGHSSSRCAGLYRCLSLRSTGSRRAGSVAVAHGPSCSAACGILPDQGSNPCPLH